MSEPISPPTGTQGADTLYGVAYKELRRLAHARLYAAGNPTLLDTTALVHESYLRLARAGELRFPDRTRFLVYAGQAMRSIIVDLIRERQRVRHGGDLVRVAITENIAAGSAGHADEDEILAVHQALDQLAAVDGRMAQVVEMRYFAGLTDAEIGAALGVTDRTVRRDWEEARLFLAQALK